MQILCPSSKGVTRRVNTGQKTPDLWGETRQMAVDAVLSEPLSWSDSLLSEINTGIFRGLCGNALALSVYILNPSDFSRLPLDKTQTEQRI